MAKTPKKCANEACSCISADGSKFCCRHCEGMSGKIELVCGCGHDDCGRSAANIGTNVPPASTLSNPPSML